MARLWCMNLVKRADSLNNQNFKYLLSLLSSVLSGKEPPKPNANTDWASVFSIAELHSVLGMTCYAVEKLPNDSKPQPELMQKFIDAQKSELILESNIQYETDRLLKVFRKHKIPLVLLKGFLLKEYYPIPCMRTMSDVDVLYNKEYKSRIKEIFRKQGYRVTVKFDEELDFVKPPFYHYEFHTGLALSNSDSYSIFSDAFTKAVFNTETGIGRLSLSDTFIYMLEHLAHHIERGGAGLRMIMDVYVYLKAEKDNLDWTYINKKLAKLKLVKFKEVITDIAYNWFGTETPHTDSLAADFVLSCCTFGSTDNALLQTAIRGEKKSGKKHSGFYWVLRRVFPEFSYIRSRFPSAEKLPFLYPFYVIAYWSIRLFKNRNVKIKNISKRFVSTDSEYAKKLVAAMEEFGLADRM